MKRPVSVRSLQEHTHYPPFGCFAVRPNRWKFVLLVTLCQIAMFAPSDAQQTSSPPPNPTITNAPALLIRIKNSHYLPADATVKIGQSVEFINDDQIGHTVTASDNSFDSGYLAKGAAWHATFSHAQKVMYSDIYHPTMHGVINVVVN